MASKRAVRPAPKAGEISRAASKRAVLKVMNTKDRATRLKAFKFSPLKKNPELAVMSAKRLNKVLIVVWSPWWLWWSRNRTILNMTICGRHLHIWCNGVRLARCLSTHRYWLRIWRVGPLAFSGPDDIKDIHDI